MKNKPNKPLKLVEGEYYRTRDGQVFGPMADTKNRSPCPYECGLGGWHSWASTGKWMPGERMHPMDLIARVPAPKSKPAKKPRAKRVPDRRVFRDSMSHRDISVSIDYEGGIGIRDLTLSKRTARALAAYLIALVDRSGK